VTEEFTQVDDALDDEDIDNALRWLRNIAASAPRLEVVRRLRRVGELAEFDDLARAADTVLIHDNAQTLFALGYACVERGAPVIAIPFLTDALVLAPAQTTIVRTLVAAYEAVWRYDDAVAVLSAHQAHLVDWPDRYLLAVNHIMVGNLDQAARIYSGLSRPDGAWMAGYERLTGILERSSHTPDRTLRGWHYLLNASVLATVSPHGFDVGMNGRYPYLPDSLENCARTLRRLRTALGDRPDPVALLPDRSSRIMGLAAAAVLGRPTVSWPPPGPAIIVAYTIKDLDPEIAEALRSRGRGWVLAEHATCWTDPRSVAADFVGLLHETIVEPWGRRLVRPLGGRSYLAEPDPRPAEEIAAEIAAITTEPDDVAPGDADDDFAAFLASVHSRWPAIAGPRDRVRSPGPPGSVYYE
jgi:hypothetical protein